MKNNRERIEVQFSILLALEKGTPRIGQFWWLASVKIG